MHRGSGDGADGAPSVAGQDGGVAEPGAREPTGDLVAAMRFSIGAEKRSN